ncbi:MAG: gliding motility-associated C-terminal domain-containing protein [bacterium]
MGKGFPFSIFLLFAISSVVFSEGTKQIVPFAGREGQLCIDKSRNDFAFFNAPPEFRLNIRITDLTEKFYFGLGLITEVDSLAVVQFQLKDPAGNIVIGPGPVPKSGQGFITSYDQAVKGPFPGIGGYDPIGQVPAMTGDYSLEFFYPPDMGSIYTYVSFVTFKYFDITVVDAANTPVTGRVWSKAWQFNCGPVAAPPTSNRFYGTMFILSDDSVVTSVNCNGFVGGTFSISSNQTGCSTTGNIAIDRQSRTGFHTYPQYKVFLCDPDSTIFPTGKAKPGIILPVSITTDCATGSVDLGIKVTQDGFIEVLMEVDPNPGADPRDVKITANVLANPGGNGFNIIHWNGNDGLGKPVPNGAQVTATMRFVHGITHLPIYDIEYNDIGYQVEVVRPPGIKPAIYWDDSLLPDGNTVNLNGCSNITGCHTWDITIGDTNTINSWWYVASSSAPSQSFTLKRTPSPPGTITGEPSFCDGGITRIYSVKNEPSSSMFTWTYSGTGATIAGIDTSATVVYDTNATSGTLSVSGSNQECGSGPPSSIPITFFPAPLVSLAGFDSTCFNEPAFQLSGGSPPGGEYMIDGTAAYSFDPAGKGAGTHTIIYRYTDEHGCKNSDSSNVYIKNGRECEIIIWVPNAFSPDGDGLNDTFKPFTNNIREFSMNIYSRYGELVFTSANPDIGWDGTYKGGPCPEGNYVYIIIYLSSFAPPENKTLSGDVVLVR